MSDIERGFISAVIRDQAIVDAAVAGITPEYFEPDRTAVISTSQGKMFDLDTNGRVWSWCLEYWRRYNATPTLESLRVQFSGYKLPSVTEPLPWFTEQMQWGFRLRIADEHIAQYNDLMLHDPEKALRTLQVGANATHLATRSAVDIIGNEAIEPFAYDLANVFRDVEALQGVATGFDRVDFMTKGLRPKQLITVIGKAKTFKSWLMLRLMLEAVMRARRALFIGFEMSNDEQLERFLAMVAEVPYDRVQSGSLNKQQRRKVELAGKRFSAYQDFVFSTDIDSAMTVSGVAAKIHQYQPRIVFIDGVYLMDDEHGEPKGTPRALTNVTRDLKKLAQRMEIPVVGSTQVLSWKAKKGVTADAIGYSSSFAQDSDLILATDRVEEDNTDVFKLKAVLARNCPTFETSVMWDWDTTTMIELAHSEAKKSDDEEA